MCNLHFENAGNSCLDQSHLSDDLNLIILIRSYELDVKLWWFLSLGFAKTTFQTHKGTTMLVVIAQLWRWEKSSFDCPRVATLSVLRLDEEYIMWNLSIFHSVVIFVSHLPSLLPVWWTYGCSLNLICLVSAGNRRWHSGYCPVEEQEESRPG